MQFLSHAMTSHLVQILSILVMLLSKHFLVLLKTSLMEIEILVVQFLCFEHIIQPVEDFACSKIFSFAFPDITKRVNSIERLCVV